MTKSILITGASSGIGYDAAHGLRDAGWRVFASCRKQVDCDRLKSEGFDAPRIDLADTSSITSGLDELLNATGGTLDALYNNGAFAIPGLLEDLPTDALRENFETNVFGYHELTRRVIPVMRAQGRGRILNCSSVLGFVPAPWRGAYVSTKYALEGLTDVLRLEMMNEPIEVISIQPGPITSKFRKNAVPKFERWIKPKESARASDYEAMYDRLYTETEPGAFEWHPRLVTDAIKIALSHPKPKPYYRITPPTKFAYILKRALPARALFKIMLNT